jgi:hypothetical protein
MPLALDSFDEHLLVGVGTTLRMYSMGKKRLLRKCECRNFPSLIRTISTHGDRICIGDMTQSFQFLKYTKDRNELIVFADDATPRYTTCGTLVDYQTVAGGDKFGNMFVLRLPDELLDDGTATSSSSTATSTTANMEQSLWETNPGKERRRLWLLLWFGCCGLVVVVWLLWFGCCGLVVVVLLLCCCVVVLLLCCCVVVLLFCCFVVVVLLLWFGCCGSVV